MDDPNEQGPVAARHRADEQRTIDRLWDFADPAGSEARFRAAADDPEATAHLRAILRTQQARAVGIQKRIDEALAILDDVETAGLETSAGAPAAPGASAPSAAERAEVASRNDLERGRLLAAAGRREEAVAALTRAVREGVAAGSTFLVLDGLHMLALNDVGHEAEWVEQGLELLAGERDPRVLRWGVALHHNLGWTLHDSGDAQGALEQFELAVAAADRLGTAEQQHVTRWSVGRALRSLGRTDEALALQRQLAETRPDDRFVQAELAALTDAGPTIEG
ncbi:hypothetical protein ACGGZK_11880 [Agromyces sp. MMS24-K17]|uniref:hypothetical protein n=1 Tax=Agromyces sp. MMS24-K17 TaxID=3372850 RepID=UPI0037550FAF